MFEYKTLLGYLTVFIGIISYVPYFKNIFAGKTKPHAFSWLVWTVLTGIAFAVQVVAHAGAGSWATGVTAVICFTVFLLSLFKGERQFTFFDWSALTVAFAALLLWRFTNNPILALALVITTDTVAFLPTFRKAFHRPNEETASTFAFAALKFAIAIGALQSFTLASWLYPTSTMILNASFFSMLLVRRKQIALVPTKAFP